MIQGATAGSSAITCGGNIPCSKQRLGRQQWANVSVIGTEQKGGVRRAGDVIETWVQGGIPSSLVNQLNGNSGFWMQPICQANCSLQCHPPYVLKKSTKTQNARPSFKNYTAVIAWIRRGIKGG
jgi:hypothetical protein